MYSIFRNLAIIILSAKFFGLVARKCKAPQVVGEILAGLVIGPCVLNLVQTSDSIATFAEIGVVLLMFTTGLGTNLKELIKAGPIATLIAAVGVAVPLVGGTLLYSAFSGFAGCGQVPSSISLRVLPNFSHRTAIRCVCPSAIVFPTRGMSSFPSFIETWIYVDTMVSHIPGNRLSPANKTIKNRRIDT